MSIHITIPDNQRMAEVEVRGASPTPQRAILSYPTLLNFLREQCNIAATNLTSSAIISRSFGLRFETNRQFMLAIRIPEVTMILTQQRVVPSRIRCRVPPRWWFLSYSLRPGSEAWTVGVVALHVEPFDATEALLSAWKWGNVRGGNVCWGSQANLPHPTWADPLMFDNHFLSLPFNFDYMEEREQLAWQAAATATTLDANHVFTLTPSPSSTQTLRRYWGQTDTITL